MADVIPFKLREPDRAARRPIDGPPREVIVLPVIWVGPPEPPAQRFGRFLNRILDGES